MIALSLTVIFCLADLPAFAKTTRPLSRISADREHHTLRTADGAPFIPFGVNYFRPDTGWAPQLWKKFDPEATRRDLELIKRLGGNTIRVFISFGSFYTTPGQLDPEGVARFNRFLELAEQARLYVHPTGPDACLVSPKAMEQFRLDCLRAFRAGRVTTRPTGG
ncbi:MAG: hypothetical protein ABSH20_03895 [Tepidisphaeraceae bacterium]|jgi:hypothetical protein